MRWMHGAIHQIMWWDGHCAKEWRFMRDIKHAHRYDAPFDLEPLDRAALVARVKDLHGCVTRQLAFAEKPDASA